MISLCLHLTSSRFIAVVLFVALMPVGISPRETVVTAKPSCPYAFMRNGNVWLHYKGQAHELTKTGVYKDFAVTNDGSYLALIRPAQNNLSTAHLMIIGAGAVKSLPTIEVSITTAVVATCGTLASVENNTELEWKIAIAKDLINKTKFTDGEYIDFRCTADRRVIVGYKSLQDRLLRARGLGDSEKHTAIDSKPNLLDVSPNGKFAAFYTSYSGPSHLCAWKIGEEAKCILHQNVFNRVSISDSGDLIFATNSGEACLFKDGEHYSTQPKPGYDNGDVCPDVGYWHPGMDEPEILESLAGHPQWLTDAAASRLLAWQERE